MSNFQFLQTEWSGLFNKMKKAEERIYTEPDSTGIKCRAVLEKTLLHVFEVEYIDLPYQPTVHSLLLEPEFQAKLPSSLMLDGLFYVKKVGNAAAHFGKVSSVEAERAINYLFTYLKWFARTYSDVEPEVPSHFDKSNVPRVGEEARKLKELKAKLEQEKKEELAELKTEIERLTQKNAEALEQAQESNEGREFLLQQITRDKEILQARKVERQVKVSPPYNEASTRKHFIDIDLKVVGWDKLREGRELEYPVKGMPITTDNPKGNGFADYVLWGSDGKPLAVIEAKRTSKEAEAGKHQAFLYANCLEAMHGQRPMIFFTNGYETYLWDDAFYSAYRRVYGFYSKEELEWMMQQRTTRKDIRLAKVNLEIAGRSYQKEAIQRVAESFVVDGPTEIRGSQRKALLVMATGSGKTRVSAALVELLMKNNWAKRILFLADRKALVKQAKDSFKEHLPQVSAINLTTEKENNTTRIVFSTYQSMISRIDNVVDEDERFYGVGHFDLIIIDEAHRSIYNRYQSIFDYFDALLVGLTATPKSFVDVNTFSLFDCDNNDPTFEFSLEEATPVYLCPFKVFEIESKFLDQGILYDDLTPDEKEHYEATFADPLTGQMPSMAFLNKATASITEEQKKWLFNKDTVNKVLDKLMTDGLKIEGGDKVGRTIIFAFNQHHARFIEECFLERYPDKPAGFVAAIYNGISHAQSLIDSFSHKDKELLPQIAISVDMMDTGIDAPRVLNLVFFKLVRSYAKFWQMIGRGTRLSPNLLGPGKDKDHFVIFDVCKNFKYFGENPDGADAIITKSLTQQVFETRLHLSQHLLREATEDHLSMSRDLLDLLHGDIFGLVKERFQVGMKRRYVDEFKPRARWNDLSETDLQVVEEHLSGLVSSHALLETTKRFDLLILKLQIANLIKPNAQEAYFNRLMTIAQKLSSKYGIPEVLRSKELIEQMRLPDFYAGLTQKRMEKLRKEIRELVKLLDASDVIPVYANYEDSELVVEEVDASNLYQPTSALYRAKVERFIEENKHHLTISKLRSNQVITSKELEALEQILFDGEERGTKEEFVKEYGEQPLGNFIRSIIGLDEGAARELFADFLQAGSLRADQMTFINQIITHLTKNGTIDKGMLFESPFTDVNDQGIFGVFDDAEVGKVISIIDMVNGNAQVG